ncbi:GNAT family N-acetyltransferase [Lacticigenium naphthae]|uniref:GNAT family N-acetyltransferase n=1 Tax=Lacticigenium naphthae TaxID=515351 RepID=UPI0004012D74|nr:GNAT family N-acetyltransferase [Lacticigenium naphthae]
MEYRQLSKRDEKTLNMKNEPFDLFGRLIIEREQNRWIHKEELFQKKERMTFPDEKMSIEEIEKKGFAIGAYQEDEIVGLAIFHDDWTKYAYLHDLKVKGSYRQQGIAGNLIEKGLWQAKKQGYAGLYTIAQDNNLGACRFYLKENFVVGGLNTHGYNHTAQEGKADIYFYKE